MCGVKLLTKNAITCYNFVCSFKPLNSFLKREGIMKKVINFVNRLPFSGRTVLRPLALIFYLSTDKKKRMRLYVSLCIVIILFILSHFLQCFLGVQSMYFHSPLWAKCIGVSYVITNAFVIIVQTHLLFRSTIFLCKGKYSEKKRIYKNYSEKEMFLMFVVTLMGQIIFFWQYVCFS